MSATAVSSTSHASEMANGGPLQATGQLVAQRPHLYVGNLSPRVTDAMLQEIFSVAGPVQAVKIIPDRSFTQGGLNYGFVEYMDMRSAESALQTLNGRNVFDSEIKVNWAKHSQHNGNQNIIQAGKEDASGSYHVFVGDLAPEINDAALRQAFSSFASLAEVRVMWDMNSGKSRGYGFVSFKDKADAEQSIATMNGEWLGSRTIRVNWANQKVQGAYRATGGVMATGMGMGRNAMVTINGGAGMTMNGMPTVIRMGPSVSMPGQTFVAAGGGGGGTSLQLNQPLSYEQVLAATPPNVTTVYCGNLPPFATHNDLMALLSPFGFIVEVRMQTDRGYAFVKLDSHEHAANAIYSLGLNGCTVHNRPAKVGWGKERQETGSTTAVAATALMRNTTAAAIGQPSGPYNNSNNMVYTVPTATPAFGGYATSNFGFPTPTVPAMAGVTATSQGN
ncbi:hypothetical protein ACQY0O_006655 [Thecaphora frezii]